MTNLTNAPHAPIDNHCPNCGQAVANVAQSANLGAFVPIGDEYMRRLDACSKEWGVRVDGCRLPTEAQFKAARWKLGGKVNGAVLPDPPPVTNWQIYGLPMENGRARRWIICKGKGFIHYHTGLMEWKNTANGRFSGKLTGRRVEFLWLKKEHSTDCRELEPSANQGQLTLL